MDGVAEIYPKAFSSTNGPTSTKQGARKLFALTMFQCGSLLVEYMHERFI